MARFGQSFLASLTQPSYGQGLFELGGTIGQAPALAAQRKKELEDFDKLSTATDRAQASAVAGDPSALSLNIKQLERLRDAATTVEQKKAINSRIVQLRNLIPDVEKRGLTKEIKAVSTIDNTLETLDVSTEQGKLLKETLTNRKKELLQDPDVQQGYRKAQIDAFTFEENERNMLKAQYLQANQGNLLAAVRSQDQSQIDKALSNVPPEFAGVASDFVTGSIRNEQVLSAFIEQSDSLKQKPLSTQEIDNIVSDLPQEVQSAVDAEIRAYTEAASGWHPEHGWSGNTKKLAQLKEAEKSLRNKVSSVGTQYLFNQINQKQQTELKERTIVKNAELALFDRPSDKAVMTRAELITEQRDGEPTQEEKAVAYQQLVDQNRQKQLLIINEYDPERAEELGYNKVSLDVAERVLTEDPSPSSIYYFISTYGQEAFDNWSAKQVSDDKGTEKPSVFETAVGVPVRETAKFIGETVIEPVSSAIALAGARRQVGMAFSKFGGDLNPITTDVLELVVNDDAFSKTTRDKIQKEINKRRNKS